MKILVIAHFQGDGSPAAIFIHDQVKAYVALGHKVRMIVPIAVGKRGWGGGRIESTIKRLQMDGVEIFFLRHLSLSNYGKRNFNTNTAIGAICRHYRALVEDFAPEVIHAHTLGLDSDLGAWLKVKTGCPLVVTTHGSDTFVPNRAGDFAFVREKANAADHLVCVSSLLERVVKTCGTSVETSVILNGFNVQYAFPQKKQPLSIVQVGSLIERKKNDVTIQAFAKIHENHPQALLTIIGHGSDRAALEQLCQKIGVADSVFFQGQLPNDQVLAQMAKAQFFCMPSVREGFGIVYLEAMASGCVTIGTEGEGIADLITSGQNGILVPPDDADAIVAAVEDCLTNPSKAQHLSESGRTSASTLTWEKNATQYSRIFEQIRKPI